MNLEEAVVDVLSGYRLTRLATADVITRPLRARVIRYAYEHDERYETFDAAGHSEVDLDEMPENDDEAPKLADFVKCRWCTGIWISVFVVVARRYAPRVWDPLARALALSATAALVAGLER